MLQKKDTLLHELAWSILQVLSESSCSTVGLIAGQLANLLAKLVEEYFESYLARTSDTTTRQEEHSQLSRVLFMPTYACKAGSARTF